MLNMPGRFCTSVIQFKTRYNTQSLYTLFAPVRGGYLSSPFPFAAHHTLKLAGSTTSSKEAPFLGSVSQSGEGGVVLLHLGQQIVLQGQQKEPQSLHLPV